MFVLLSRTRHALIFNRFRPRVAVGPNDRATITPPITTIPVVTNRSEGEVFLLKASSLARNFLLPHARPLPCPSVPSESIYEQTPLRQCSVATTITMRWREYAHTSLSTRASRGDIPWYARVRVPGGQVALQGRAARHDESIAP